MLTAVELLDQEEKGIIASGKPPDPVVEDAKCKREGTAKRWCFTSHNVPAPVFDQSKMEALEFQQEICPKSGRLHWQGWVVFNDRFRMQPVKGMLGNNNIHLEKMKGSILSNRKYCSKTHCTMTEDTTIHTGIVLRQGDMFLTQVPGTHKFFGNVPDEDATHKWQALKMSMLNVAKGEEEYRDAVQSNFQLMVQYPTGIKQILTELVAPTTNSRPVVNVCIWGVAGAGKTRWVFKNWTVKDVYFKSKPTASADWWDGYQGQKVVVWDDFYGEHKFSDMLNWTDTYFRQVPVKGAFVWLRNTINVFTSNKDPSTWWSNLLGDPLNMELLAAWRRRLPDGNRRFVAVPDNCDFKFEDWDGLEWLGTNNIRQRVE